MKYLPLPLSPPLSRLKFYNGPRMIVDTGCLCDMGLKGGRLGVFAFSQQNVIFSNLHYECLSGKQQYTII